MKISTMVLAAAITASSGFALAQGGAGGVGSGDAGGSSSAGVTGQGMTDTRPTPTAPRATTGSASPYERKNDTKVYQNQKPQGNTPQPPNPHGG